MIKLDYIRIILLLLLWMGITSNSQAQDEKFKAIFIYNFIKHLNWAEKPESYIICILGESPIIGELESIASVKTIGNSALKIVKANSVNDITKCQIVFVTSDKTSLISKLFEKSSEENYLLIAEKQNACAAGAGINFLNKNGKLVYEISKSNIEKSGLRVGSDLLRLGIPVNN